MYNRSRHPDPAAAILAAALNPLTEIARGILAGAIDYANS